MTATLLYSLTFQDPVAGGAWVVRLAQGATYDHPSAPGPYLDAVLDRSALKREIFQDGTPFGASAIDYGNLMVANLDGKMDRLITNGCVIDGGTVQILLGDADGPLDGFSPIFTGTIDQALPGPEQCEVRFKDDMAALVDTPIQSRQFGGTNVQPDGIDGGDELKDQYLPVIYGTVKNVSATCVNAWRYIFIVADRGPVTLNEVRVKGTVILPGQQRTLVDLQIEANVPAAGHYDWCPGDADTPCYFRLAAAPNGDVTVDASEGATAADRTPAQIWRRVMIERAGRSPAALSADDIAALDGQVTGECGFAAGTDAVDIRDRLDAVATTAGAGYWTDGLGLWRIRRIDVPAGEPVITWRRFGIDQDAAIDEADIISLEPIFTSRSDGGVPAGQITVQYDHNYTVQSKDALVGIALDKLEWYSREDRPKVVPILDVQAAHPLAAKLEFTSLFVNEADAAELGNHLASIFGRYVRRYTLKTQLTAAVAGRLDIGIVGRVFYPRWGFDAGQLVLVTAMQPDAKRLTADLTIMVVT